ncbi:MAG: sugar transporter permease, partial [Microbacterium sp.]|nr:sugar transporter permease [Microbacterium sp.]
MTAKRPLYATVLMYLALAAYLIFLGFPLLWLLSASFKSSQELNSLAVNLIPIEWDFSNYASALERQNLLTAAGNSIFVSVVTMVIAVLLSMPMAYALARLKGR